jgi:AcrR family transcriptional regulator
MDNAPASRPALAERQRAREEHILAATQSLLVRHRGDPLTIARLAIMLRMPPGAIRRHFPDIDSILAEILMRHLAEISLAIGKVPHNHPNRCVEQRAVYIAVTRTADGDFTEPHLLLLRKRHTLPRALAKPVEDMRRMIGEALGGDRAAAVMTVLEIPKLPAAQIEAMLAAYKPNAAAPAHPAPPPAQTKPNAKPGQRNWLH